MRPDEDKLTPVSGVLHRLSSADVGFNPTSTTTGLPTSTASAAPGPDQQREEEEGDDDLDVPSNGYSSLAVYDEGNEDDYAAGMDYGSVNAPQHHLPVHHELDLYGDSDTYTSDEEDLVDDGGAPLGTLFEAIHAASSVLQQSHASSSAIPPGNFMPLSHGDEAYEAHTHADNWQNFASFLYGSADPLGGPDWLDAGASAGAGEDMDVDAGADWAVPLGSDLDDDGNSFGLDTVLDPEDDGFGADDFFAFSTPNHQTLNPGNLSTHQFLEEWALHSRHFHQPSARLKGRCPDALSLAEQVSVRGNDCIRYGDLEGDKFDVQGINWEDLGVSRKLARVQRSHTYKNYVNKHGSDLYNPRLVSTVPSPDESFFRFRQMNIRRNVHLAHFQLRNVLASTSRDRVFYTSAGAVQQLNPLTGQSSTPLRFDSSPQAQVTSLAADYGLLVAGSFNGRYCIWNLNSEFIDGEHDVHEGSISSDISAITNHVQLHIPRRSSTPHAAFASNDLTFRGLDLATETFVHETKCPFALNCTAVSPDGRLRVMVGDHTSVFIAAAEPERNRGDGPDLLCELQGHRDYGFACDWADDGYTVATGFQDRLVKIWDARRWTDASGRAAPVATLRTELAGARCLKFSPLGSGRRVLVAAEEADFVDVFDAQTFEAKQTFDVFGELGGVAFANGGQDLLALSCDPWRGGVIRLERCGAGFEAVHNDDVFAFGYGSGVGALVGMAPGDLRWDRGMDFDWPARVGQRVPAGAGRVGQLVWSEEEAAAEAAAAAAGAGADAAAAAVEERNRRIRARRRVRNAAVADLEPF